MSVNADGVNKLTRCRVTQRTSARLNVYQSLRQNVMNAVTFCSPRTDEDVIITDPSDPKSLIPGDSWSHGTHTHTQSSLCVDVYSLHFSILSNVSQPSKTEPTNSCIKSTAGANDEQETNERTELLNEIINNN